MPALRRRDAPVRARQHRRGLVLTSPTAGPLPGRLPVVVAALAALGIAAVLLAAPRTSTVEGVVVAVEARSLADVAGFTLRTAGGALVEFGLEALENEAEFPPGHLAEHAVSSVPVVVTYRDEGGRHLAIRIVDAPVGSPT